MAAPKPKSRDFGAALAGLVLGGSTMFLIVLTIVWLTNRHFAGKHEAEKAAHAPPSQVTVPGPTPSTTGTGSQAPVAPPANTPGAQATHPPPPPPGR